MPGSPGPEYRAENSSGYLDPGIGLAPAISYRKPAHFGKDGKPEPVGKPSDPESAGNLKTVFSLQRNAFSSICTSRPVREKLLKQRRYLPYQRSSVSSAILAHANRLPGL